METVTYADTNVLLWLLGARDLVSKAALDHLRRAEAVLVSPNGSGADARRSARHRRQNDP